MDNYYMGLAIGGLIGYCLALITLVTMWGLCVVAHNNEVQDNENDTDSKTEQFKKYS